MIKYRHRKTGNIYILLGAAVDCTNSRDGTPVAIYTAFDAGPIFVRDWAEFIEKFENINVAKGAKS